jgi:hypothetical protein
MPSPKNTKPATTTPTTSGATAKPAGTASGPDTATPTGTRPRPRTAASGPAPARTAPPAARDTGAGNAPSRTRPTRRPQPGAAARPATPAPGTATHDAPASPPPASADGGPKRQSAPAARPATPAAPAMTRPAATTESPAAAAPQAGNPDRTVPDTIAGHAGQIREAADAVTAALRAGDLRAALAGIEEIRDQSASARRTLRAATGSRRAPGPATHPGGLREKVAAHLRSHPGKEFTPHEIGKVIGHSSGAIANALDTLVRRGNAELATEKPRRFRHLPGAGDTARDPLPAASAAAVPGAA